MFVRIYYLMNGRHEKVVTWKQSIEECQQFIQEKGGEMLKVSKYEGNTESHQSRSTSSEETTTIIAN